MSGDSVTEQEIRKLIKDFPWMEESLSKLQNEYEELDGASYQKKEQLSKQIKKLEKKVIRILNLYDTVTNRREDMVIFCKLEGKTYREIAEMMMISKDTVRKIYNEAIRKMAAYEMADDTEPSQVQQVDIEARLKARQERFNR